MHICKPTSTLTAAKTADPNNCQTAHGRAYLITRKSFLPLTMIRLFEGGRHADLYKKFRRPTPDFVTTKVLAYLEEALPSRPHGIAVDVGCGSGQNTLCYAPYFDEVLGLDVSLSQVEEGQKTPGLPVNVRFDVAPAEALPLEDHSVELVTGGFSFHWFDFDRFYAEVDRILVANGAVAAIAHSIHRAVHPDKAPELNLLMDDFIEDNLERCMHPRNKHPFSDYQDLPLPYQDQVRLRGLPLDLQLTVTDVAGAFASWSSFQMEYEENPQKTLKALDDFQSEFMKILGANTPVEETPIVMRYNYCLVMCRKPPI